MVQGYPQKNSGSSGGWCSVVHDLGVRAVFPFSGIPCKEGGFLFSSLEATPEAVQRGGGSSRSYIRGTDPEQWSAYPPKRTGLSGSVPSDFSFDMVAKFNEYKMCIVGEEITGVPGIGFVEGMVCGCAYIGLNNGLYEQYGLKEGVHYIGYDGTLPDLTEK